MFVFYLEINRVQPINKYKINISHNMIPEFIAEEINTYIPSVSKDYYRKFYIVIKT